VSHRLYHIEELIKWSTQQDGVLSIVLKDEPEPIVTRVRNYLSTAAINMLELMPETLYGREIKRTTIPVSEIIKIRPLAARYNDPVYVRLRESKKRFLQE
jgi:hypothetical protein